VNGGVQKGVRRSGSRVSHQDQLVDGAENVGCATSHHRVDVPEVATRWYTGARCGPAGRRELRLWPAHGGGRRGRGRRSEPHSLTGLGQREPKERPTRGGGRRGWGW
jgi:hypothetical protein